MKNPSVYFLTNKNNTVIYIGVTSNLNKRIYEQFSTMNDAISREKQLKSGNRKKKEDLINKENPNWLDLSENWLFNI